MTAANRMLHLFQPRDDIAYGVILKTVPPKLW